MFKVRPLGVPEHCQQKLFSRGMWHETLKETRSCVLPLHALLFGLSILVNSSFICPLMVQIKKLSPSWLYGYKRLDQMYLLHLCSSVKWLGTHLAKTLWNPRMSCNSEWAVPWLKPSCSTRTISSVVVLSVRILALVLASHHWLMFMTVRNAWHQLGLSDYF